ncbi:STK33, partial [Symbiodinium sp. CCMP2456]
YSQHIHDAKNNDYCGQKQVQRDAEELERFVSTCFGQHIPVHAHLPKVQGFGACSDALFRTVVQVAPTIEEEALKNVVDDKGRKVRKGQLSDDDMWQLRDPAGDETLAKLY